MGTFVFQPLLWGLIAVGAPLLIHLINMMRHRKIRWAAMEFLLQSQKRNRTWIMLKQFLLLLLRMAAIAAVVLLVAQPLFKKSFASFLGGTRTHHIVLLDDSYSQADEQGKNTSFKSGIEAVGKIFKFAVNSSNESEQTFSLVRFSQAVDSETEFKSALVNDELKSNIESRLKDLRVSELDTGPEPALKLTKESLATSPDEKRIYYIISDFRRKDWQEPAAIKELLADLTKSNGEVHFVSCAAAAHRNLAVVGLEPEPGVRAAGVEVFMRVYVRNFSQADESNVNVTITRKAADAKQTDEPIAAVKIEKVPAGRTGSARFKVNFPDAGMYPLVASLSANEDPLPADDKRYYALNIAAVTDALLIDGDPNANNVSNAGYVKEILELRGKVKTGVRATIAPTTFLRKNAERLREYSVIYLLNVDRMDEGDVKVLDNYVRQGGGVAFFMGPLCSADFFNKNLYNNGAGIFPLPVVGPVSLLVDRTEKIPDIVASDHEIFRVFAGQSSSLIGMMSLEKYFAAPRDWQPSGDTTKVIATTRNGAPLIVEKTIGKGRSIAILTTAAPTWNNWAKVLPGIPIVLQMHSYLAFRPETDHRVGNPLDIFFIGEDYAAPFRWKNTTNASVEDLAVPPANKPDDKGNTAGVLKLLISGKKTRNAGFYDLELTKLQKLDAPADQPGDKPADKKPATPPAGATSGKQNTAEHRLIAFNVAPDEGDLAMVAKDNLYKAFDPIDIRYELAEELSATSAELAGLNVSRTWGFLFVLVLLLMGEQFLAYAISYHPTPKEAKQS